MRFYRLAKNLPPVSIFTQWIIGFIFGPIRSFPWRIEGFHSKRKSRVGTGIQTVSFTLYCLFYSSWRQTSHISKIPFWCFYFFWLDFCCILSRQSIQIYWNTDKQCPQRESYSWKGKRKYTVQSVPITASSLEIKSLVCSFRLWILQMFYWLCFTAGK